MGDPTWTPWMFIIAVVAMFVLVWGGVRQYRHDRTKGVLMIVCALVLLGNLLIWTV